MCHVCAAESSSAGGAGITFVNDIFRNGGRAPGFDFAEKLSRAAVPEVDSPILSAEITLAWQLHDQTRSCRESRFSFPTRRSLQHYPMRIPQPQNWIIQYSHLFCSAGTVSRFSNHHKHWSEFDSFEGT
jgi:hypothetical protein